MFTRITTYMLTEPLERPFASTASTASLPLPPLRLLPGGTNQFPGGTITPLKSTGFTAHDQRFLKRTDPYTEPWLRGTHAEVPAAARAVLHALELAHDDLVKGTEGLSDAEVHAHPLGLTPVAYHLKHIARSMDRILTYAEGDQLTTEQLAAMKGESVGAETLSELLAELGESLDQAAQRVRALSSSDFNTPRGVGRKQMPTSVGGALIHVADHTQRHVGQVVTTAKVLKALRTQAATG